MGMAAGQARLLSITARLSDNEQRGQSVSYAKERLADEADQINREYNEALNATKLTMLTGFNGTEPQYTDISYGLLTAYNKQSAGKQYLVTDQKGQILVTKEEADAYKKGNGDFNVFLNELGYSQNDVDFAQIKYYKEDNSLDTDKIKTEGYQHVHDAWDRYLKSVGLSFEDYEHDLSNDHVEFCYEREFTDYYGNKKTLLGPYVKIKRYNATIKNELNGEKIIDRNLGGFFQALDRGNTGLPALIKNENDENVPYYIYGGTPVMMLYQAESSPNYYHIFEWNDTANEYVQCKDSEGNPIRIPADNVILKQMNGAGGTIIYPLNFEGTTQEQRELYDYAVEVTKAYTDFVNEIEGITSKLIPDDGSIADDPENSAAVKHYRNIFNEMAKFGYVTEDDLHINKNVTKLGKDDNNWFEQQLRQGKLLLKTYDASKGGFVTTTFEEDSNIQEVEDERKIAKATLEYNQAQEALERKDKKFDLELKRLDTEHNALQTEYDAVKGVVNKNIEKSFQMFS